MAARNDSSRCSNSAAVAAAMTAGALPPIPEIPMGQTRDAIRSSGRPASRKPLDEPRPLGAAADQADIGEAAIGQSGVGDIQVQGVAVAHDQHETAGRRHGDLAHGRGRDDAVGISRQARGKGLGAHIDPGDLQRQRRQCQHQRPADMASAEQQDRAAGLAKMLDEDTVGGDMGRLRRRAIGFQPLPEDPAIDILGAAGEAAAGLQRGKIPHLDQRLPVDDLDQQGHPAAAALAELRPERLADPAGPGTARLQRPLRLGQGAPFQVPPPMVPWKPPSGSTTIRAPASRGVEPSVAATVTMAQRPWLARASAMWVHTTHIIPALSAR